MTDRKVHGVVTTVVTSIHFNQEESLLSKYRYELRHGVLIRTKRSLLRWWNWSFNRSEEDMLTRMKNEYTMGNERLKFLRKAIPALEKELNTRREQLDQMGGVTAPFTDKWSPRKEPVRLREATKFARKKADRPPKPKPLFTINQADK